MNMTREQLASWCALEGIALKRIPAAERSKVYSGTEDSGLRGGWRFIRIETFSISHIKLQYYQRASAWELGDSTYTLSDYEDGVWTDLPEELYNSLTVELLESIK